jgi:hypothetical protein
VCLFLVWCRAWGRGWGWGWSACPRMGVRAWGLPLLGGLPLLFFPCLAVGVALLAALFPSWLVCGVFVFLACLVAGCQVASRLSSRSVSFPLFFFYYTTFSWFCAMFLWFFLWFLFSFNCLMLLLFVDFVPMVGLLLVRRAGDKPPPLLTRLKLGRDRIY